MKDEKGKLRGHTSQAFDQELRDIKNLVLTMGGKCERLIAQSVKVFTSQDPTEVDLIKEGEVVINQEELAIDEMAIRLLALRQPLGQDLRFIVATIKIVTDLERIGDETINIVERAEEMFSKEVDQSLMNLLSEMSQDAMEMLNHALDAFVEEDAEKAKQVFKEDDKVDELYGKAIRSSLEYMKENPSEVHSGMRIANCAKYIERIADHATNIAEMVVYIVEGKDVRHPYAQKMLKEKS